MLQSPSQSGSQSCSALRVVLVTGREERRGAPGGDVLVAALKKRQMFTWSLEWLSDGSDDAQVCTNTEVFGLRTARTTCPRWRTTFYSASRRGGVRWEWTFRRRDCLGRAPPAWRDRAQCRQGSLLASQTSTARRLAALARWISGASCRGDATSVQTPSIAAPYLGRAPAGAVATCRQGPGRDASAQQRRA